MSFSGSGADSMTICGLIRYMNPTLAFVHGIGFVLFLDLDDEIEVLLCTIIDCDIMGLKLSASIEFAVEPIDGLLHSFNGLLITAS